MIRSMMTVNTSTPLTGLEAKLAPGNTIDRRTRSRLIFWITYFV
jgi:hypothetical protein